MIIRLAFATIALALIGADAAPVIAKKPAPVGLCTAGETPVYSCRFGKKIGSICANSGKLSYRFGRAAAPEIEIASDENWSNVHLGSVIGQQGGHQTHVRLTNGNTHYLIFEGKDGQLSAKPGRSYSGIAVLKGAQGQKILATLSCARAQTNSANLLTNAEAVVPPNLRERVEEEVDSPFDGWF